ncbi:MAG TPA: CoA transferase [Candidatus Binataceae bacterium]|nr:CoA transferase [Candidatus Binataceae bacterium]
MSSYKRIFEGVRIVDVTQYLAGPVATRLFVDLGAEVIKVEPPLKGEGSRRLHFSPTDGGKGAPGLYFAMHNRGKKCVCIDFKRPEGAAIVKDLARGADVLIENYTPGVLRRYGLSYETISAANPNIVMCSISTYGQDSPYAARIGNDLVALAAGGLLHMMGEPDGHPVYPASAIADHMTALNAFGAISAALFHRQRTGEGQYIDLALVDCAYNSHDWQLAAFSASAGELDPQRGGSQRTGAFPYGVFKSRDGYVGIGVFTDPQWEVLVKRMGREDLLAVPELQSAPGRAQNQDALKLIIEEWLATFPDDDSAIEVLADELRLPAARLLSVGQFASDPVLSRRMVAKMRGANGVESMFLQSPHKFSKTPPSIPGPAAALGQHTRQVLREACGYSDEKLAALLQNGLIVENPMPDAI